MAKYFSDLAAWRELLAGDFNRGYLSGVLLVLAVVVLLLVIRLVVGFIFRTRRVRSMVVPAADGEVMISRDAVVAAVEGMLTGFPELMIDSLKIYRRGGVYSLLLHCRFRVTESAVFPEVAQKMKETVFAGMQKQFGVENLRKIRIVLTELENSGTKKDAVPAEESAAPAESAVTGGDQE